MATLHVRNVPDELYSTLKDLAQKKKRSLSAEVTVLLDQVIREEAVRTGQSLILEGIRVRRFVYPESRSVHDSVALLREDRER